MEKFENKNIEERINTIKQETEEMEEAGDRNLYDPDGSGMLLTKKQYDIWKKEHSESGINMNDQDK